MGLTNILSFLIRYCAGNLLGHSQGPVVSRSDDKDGPPIAPGPALLAGAQRPAGCRGGADVHGQEKGV